MRKKISAGIVSSLILVGAITAIPQTNEYEITSPIEYERGANYTIRATRGRVVEKTSWLLPDEAEIIPTSFQSEFHTGRINYLNKNTGKFESINTDLVETSSGWEMRKAGYEVELPKKSNQAIRFFVDEDNIDFTLFKIDNQLLNTVDGVKTEHHRVIYSDVTNGIDLQLSVGFNSFQKGIVIKKKPIFTGDFFEIEFKTNRSFIKKTKERFQQGKIYFRKPRATDSRVPSTSISAGIELDFQQGKMIKRIPREFLENAVYPVYTDTHGSDFAGAGDGAVSNEDGDTSWATAHDRASGVTANPTDTSRIVAITAQFGGGFFRIDRGFLPIDTSAIPAGDNITAATLNLNVQSSADSDDDGDDYIAVVETFQADNTTLGTSDYEDCGYDSGNETGARAKFEPTVEGSDQIDLTGIGTGYKVWTLNSTGLGWVKRSGESSTCGSALTGWTCLGVREGHDLIDSPIATATINFLDIAFSEFANTSSDPYLDVTHSSAARRIIIVESYFDKFRSLFTPLALAFSN